jgi:FKBP-type peptidyl-prolyl cis-trans isomerase (trigger factor)
MKFQTKNLDHSQAEITIEFDKEDLIPFKIKALEELGNKLTLNGYREGKAPPDLIENHVSPMEIAEKTVIFALEKFYPQIISDSKLDAIGQPLINITKLVPGSSAELKIQVTILPVLNLPDYKKIAKNKKKEDKSVNVEDKEIEDALTWLQNSKQTINPEIQKQEKPVLDDKFAQSLGKFKDLEDLKKNIKEGIIIEKEERAKEQWRLSVIEDIIKQIKEDIPEILIQAEKEKMFDELKIQVQGMYLSIDDYLKQIKKTEEEIKKDFQPLAEKRVKMALILKQIEEAEKIDIPDEEIEKKTNDLVSHLPDPNLKDKLNLDELKTFALGLLRNEKVFQLLEEQATS